MPKPIHPLRRLFQHARPYRASALMASVHSVLNKLFDVLPELLIGVAVDIVVNQQDSFLAGFGIVDPLQQLLWLTALTVVVWALESWFQFLYQLRWRNLAQDIQHELRQAAYEHVQRMPPQFVEKHRSGRLMALLNEDVNQVERFLNTGANDLIQVFVSSILVSAIFFFMAPELALLALLPVPLILYGAFWFQRRLAPRYAAVRESAGALSARLSNNLGGMATIQAYTAEATESAHLKAASDDFRSHNAEAIRFSAAITPAIRIAVLMGFIATLLYGGWLTLRGELGVGIYSALVYLTQRLLWPLTRLADITDLYNRSMASVRRLMDLLESPLPARAAGVPSVPARGAISYEQVSFAYDGRPAVRDVSLDIPAGQTMALVGGTGSGKSTLLKLLLRFIDPDAGRIGFDGDDIAGIDPTLLRQAIGYVAQEPFLTDGSVADNIAYGVATPERSRIQAAAVAAEADAFIRSMPDGYDSPVGERGSLLSGGQRQRIALARALYRDPALLILDEATSAVDNETEAAIQRSLLRVSQGRTTLVVAHRLSTVRHADRIHVMDAGRIVESGSHDELLAADGAYAALWRLQTGEISI